MNIIKNNQNKKNKIEFFNKNKNLRKFGKILKLKDINQRKVK